MKYKDDILTDKIIQCIIRVHQVLGPGFLESIYRKALSIEFKKNSIKAENEKEIIVCYENEQVGIHRLDILAENSVIVELKTVDALTRAHYAQIRSYMKASDIKVGILVNFAKEKADYRRIEL